MLNEVFVLENHIDYEGSQIIGIYSSVELAAERITGDVWIPQFPESEFPSGYEKCWKCNWGFWSIKKMAVEVNNKEQT